MRYGPKKLYRNTLTEKLIGILTYLSPPKSWQYYFALPKFRFSTINNLFKKRICQLECTWTPIVPPEILWNPEINLTWPAVLFCCHVWHKFLSGQFVKTKVLNLFFQTTILVELYSTARSEKYFKDPLELKPERWLRENKDENHTFSSLPFGFGPRMCLGNWSSLDGSFPFLSFWRAGMAHWWERSPLTSVARIRLPVPVHMWVAFVVGSRPYSERCFSGYSGFFLSSKTNISKFQFDVNTVDKEPPCGCATANSHLFIYLFIYIIYLFIYLLFTCTLKEVSTLLSYSLVHNCHLQAFLPTQSFFLMITCWQKNGKTTIQNTPRLRTTQHNHEIPSMTRLFVLVF